MTTFARSKASELGRWLPGLLLSLVAIGLLYKLVNWREVVTALTVMELGWLILAILFYLAGVFFRAFTWRTLLQNKAGFNRVFLTLNEGYLLNNVFPLRLGEIGRVLLLSQASNLSAFFVLSTIVIERAYDLAIAAGLLLATLPLVLNMESAQTVVYVVAILVGFGLILLFLLAQFRDRIRKFLESLGTSNQYYKTRILPWLDSFIDGLEVLTRVDSFLLSVFLILLSWLFGAFEIQMLIMSLGISAPWWWVGFALGVVSLGIALPSAPASLGVYEAAMVGALSLVGIPPAQALAIAIIAHLIHILSTGLIGGYALVRDGQNLSGIYDRLKNVRLSRYQ